MNDIKKKAKKIKITKNDQYEGQLVFDYLISSMEETNNQVNKIHSDISKKIQNNNIESITKEQENKINEEFNQVFKINNENDKSIFNYISDINKNHIKKYKTILKFLNLNLVLEKNIDKKKDEIKENSKNESNFTVDSQIKDKHKEIIIEQKKEDKIKEKEMIQIQENLDDKNNDKNEKTCNKESSVRNNSENNNNIKDELNKAEEIKDKQKKEIDDNNSSSIVDFKDNVNYFKFDDMPNKFKNKKFFLDGDDEPELENEDNDIIINENDDDTIPYSNENDSKIIKHIKESKSITLEEEFNNNKNLPNIIINSNIKVSEIDNNNSNESIKKIIKQIDSNINLDNIDNNINKKINSDNEEINNETNTNRINIKKVEQRLFRKNNTTNNMYFSFLDDNNKNNICTCEIY